MSSIHTQPIRARDFYIPFKEDKVILILLRLPIISIWLETDPLHLPIASETKIEMLIFSTGQFKSIYMFIVLIKI